MDQGHPSRLPKGLIALALGGILLLSALLRLHGIGFGLPALNDPDELMFELGATRMLTSGSMNPGWFGHPATTTMYVLAIVNCVTFGLGWLQGQFFNPDAFLQAIYVNPGLVILPGRVAMAAFGLLCVWQTYRLGKQVGKAELGVITGLVASLLLACSPVHVTYSQIIRSDVMGTAFMLLCLGAALRITERGRTNDYYWAALWLALAVASKWPFALAALGVLGAALWRLRKPEADAALELSRLARFVALSVILLFLVSPYLVLDHVTVLGNLAGEARTQHLGSTGGSLLANAWWYLHGPLRAGLGLAGLIFAAGGLLLLAGDRRPAAVLLPVMLSYAVVICAHSLRWERWAVPMLPLLSVAAGLGVARGMKMLAKYRRARVDGVLTLAVVSTISVVLAISAWTQASARTHDTRQAASAWAKRKIPAGSTVLIEHFAFDLFDQPWTILFPLGEVGCVNAHDVLAGRIDYHAVEAARAGRSNIDYGTVTETKRDSCAADYAILAQMDRYRAEQDRFPAEWGAYSDLLAGMRETAEFVPDPGVTTGPAVRVLKRRGN